MNGITTTATYNSFGELATFAASTPLGTLYDLQLSYDKLGRVSGKVETIAGVSTRRGYDYDGAGRLAAVTTGTTQVASYGYDGNDNRTQIDGAVVATVDAQDRLLTHGGASFAYSAAGQLVSRAQGAQVTTYGYDIYGNLLSVALPGGGQIGYLVDGSQRRIGKRVNGTVVRRWLYQDALRVAAEVDATGAVVARYVYGERPNVPEYMVKAGITYRLLTDHLGSVRLVVNSTTGAVAQHMDYDEWGKVTSDSNPGFQPFGFAGGLYDADTGLVRFGARDYDAATGRWTAKDPIRFEGGDLNQYAYVESNPVSLVDPTGELAWGLIFGGADLAWQLYQNGGSPQCVNWRDVGLGMLGGGLLNAIGKGAFRIKTVGSHTWNATRSWMNRRGIQPPAVGQQRHHWLFERNQGIGRDVPDAVKNQPFNTNPISAAFNNWLSRHPELAWMGGPSWAGEVVSGGTMAGAGGADDCTCQR